MKFMFLLLITSMFASRSYAQPSCYMKYGVENKSAIITLTNLSAFGDVLVDGDCADLYFKNINGIPVTEEINGFQVPMVASPRLVLEGNFEELQGYLEQIARQTGKTKLSATQVGPADQAIFRFEFPEKAH